MAEKNIRLLRLLTGEDILAELKVINEVYYLNNPIVVVAMPGQPGKAPNIGFAPWMPYSKDRQLIIDGRNILCHTAPLPEFITQYNSIHSKLDLPVPSKLII